MACTRFSNDPARIAKNAAISTFAGRYQLNVPGNGLDVPYINDPHIRLTKWGANHRTNMVDIQSDLYGLTRPYNRDIIGLNSHYDYAVASERSMNYSTVGEITDESRAMAPAWIYREMDSERFITGDMTASYPLMMNPLDRVDYHNYLNSYGGHGKPVVNSRWFDAPQKSYMLSRK